MTLLMTPILEKTKLMTGEELALRHDLGNGELVRGEFVKMPPPGSEHGRIESKIAFYLRLYAQERDAGEVFSGEAGIYTRRSPDTVRGMDVAFVSWERLEKNDSSTYLTVAPELIVEVLSPGNRWVDILDKVDEYKSIGVDLVWVVDPKRKEVFAFKTLDDVKRFSADDTLTDDDVLLGFSLRIDELFRKGRRRS